MSSKAREEAATIKFDGSDYRGLLTVLIQALEMTEHAGRPEIIVNGRRFHNFDLLKVAFLLPDESLSVEDQGKIDALFKAKQRCYRGAGINLVGKINSLHAARRMRAALLGSLPDRVARS